MAALPNLITDAYAAGALAAIPLSPAQQAFVPQAIAAASQAVRRFCMDRDFTQQTYTGVILPVALDGYVRLPQIPINQVLRVQCNPTQCVTITNSSTSVQFAQVLYAYTGDVAAGQVITGLTLNWTSNGTPSTQTLSFTADETISDLAAAITGVGSGWSADADSVLGAWPVTELYQGLIATGAGSGAVGQSVLYVFADDIAGAQFHPDDGQLTGLLFVGRQYPGIGWQWGPYPMQADWDNATYNVVKVAYNAGFAAIPDIVQFACGELVRVMVQRMRINPYLEREQGGEYSYGLAVQMLRALPEYVLQELAAYRITNA